MIVPRPAGRLRPAFPAVLFSLVELLLCSRASAQETPPEEPLNLGPVVVTATRLPTPESEVGSSVTVITAAEIEQKQERTLPDVLNDVPGLNVVQTGGPGGETSVYMRGTNATPIPVVAALNANCAAMCSTATGAYGSPDKKTEVPRTALMEALENRIGNRLVRSDWVAAAGTKPDPQARQELPALPTGFSTPEELYIDYNL